jgi:hypothetical protein
LGQAVCKLSNDTVQRGARNSTSVNSLSESDSLETFIKINPLGQENNGKVLIKKGNSGTYMSASEIAEQIGESNNNTSASLTSTADLELQLAQNLQLWLKALSTSR